MLIELETLVTIATRQEYRVRIRTIRVGYRLTISQAERPTSSVYRDGVEGGGCADTSGGVGTDQLSSCIPYTAYSIHIVSK